MFAQLRRSVVALGTVFALGAGLTATEAKAWSLEDAAAPYKGSEINIICEGYPPCYALQEVSAEFTEKTGIAVNFEFGDLLAIAQRMVAEQMTESEHFDGMQVLSYHLGLFGEQNFATPMATFLDDPALRDPSFKWDDFVPALIAQSSMYKGEAIALPFQFLATFGVIRKDIIADTGERAAFKAMYGYDLPEPGLVMEMPSYDQWRDIAAFFSRKAGETLAGKTLEQDYYGISSPFKRHLTVFWFTWANLIAHGGEIFDADGNVVIGEGTAAVDTVQFLLDMREFAPAELPGIHLGRAVSRFLRRADLQHHLLAGCAVLSRGRERLRGPRATSATSPCPEPTSPCRSSIPTWCRRRRRIPRPRSCSCSGRCRRTSRPGRRPWAGSRARARTSSRWTGRTRSRSKATWRSRT